MKDKTFALRSGGYFYLWYIHRVHVHVKVLKFSQGQYYHPTIP